MATEATRVEVSCARCSIPMWSYGHERIRIGGSTGVWSVLLGGWADAGEGYMTLEVLTCERCRTIELRRPPDAE